MRRLTGLLIAAIVSTAMVAPTQALAQHRGGSKVRVTAGIGVGYDSGSRNNGRVVVGVGASYDSRGGSYCRPSRSCAPVRSCAPRRYYNSCGGYAPSVFIPHPDGGGNGVHSARRMARLGG